MCGIEEGIIDELCFWVSFELSPWSSELRRGAPLSGVDNAISANLNVDFTFPKHMHTSIRMIVAMATGQK